MKITEEIITKRNAMKNSMSINKTILIPQKKKTIKTHSRKTNNMICLISVEGTEFIVKQQRELQGQFHWRCLPTIQRRNNNQSCQISYRRQKVILSYSFYGALITLIPKQNQHYKKENLKDSNLYGQRCKNTQPHIRKSNTKIYKKNNVA